MTKRFRMIAGPNGSGKSTLMHRLERDYAVNFYDFLNADDIFAEVKRTGSYLPHISVEEKALEKYAIDSEYANSVKACFDGKRITIDNDCVRFHDTDAINSYTVALLTNFLQRAYILSGVSFSQETVFSHPSKIEALKAARDAGYRTYLYYIATDSWKINSARVANRAKQGGHDVPADKIAARYQRSLELLPEALPYLSRAYFFDNSGEEMKYLGQWNERDGLVWQMKTLPIWLADKI